MSHEVKLLPCPFCGNPDIEYDIICIECRNCGASGGPRRVIGADGVLTSEELWNRRRPTVVTGEGQGRQTIGELVDALSAAKAVLRHGSSRSARMLLTQIDLALASAQALPTVCDWWKPGPQDPFYMLEAEDGEWLKNEHSLLGTRDPAKALRFPTAADAERFRKGNWPARWWTAKVTEHSWIAQPEVNQ